MKTFTAHSMPEVLALVKQTYGSDGVILHTRSYKRGGLMGFGARQVVEVTATDGRTLAKKYKKTPAEPPRRRMAKPESPYANVLPVAPRPQRVAPDQQASAGNLIRRTYAAARADMDTQAAARKTNEAVSRTPVNPVATATADPQPSIAPVSVITQPAPDPRIADELTAMKHMMVKLMRQQKAAVPKSRSKAVQSATPELPDPLVTQYLKLIEQEVAEELAEEIVTKVGQSLSSEEMSDPGKVCRAVHDEIAKRLPVEMGAGELEPTDDGRPRTIALIGPTGVGKTTTIAKLAATFKLKQGKKVGLITMDTYRIAAVEQLRTYASIIGLPLKVVDSAQQLAEALESYKDLDAVLIDTAGRSQRAADKLGELKQTLAAAKPHHVHLVLSSTANQKVLLQTIERFSAVEADSIIFTKLDEAVTGGVLLNVARRVGKKVSYITTGQEVPHEIEPGCSDRLASLVMGEGNESE